MPEQHYCCQENISFAQLSGLMGVIALSRIEADGYTFGVSTEEPTFGANLKRLRRLANPPITQQDLARRLSHANNSTISKWETQSVVPEPATIVEVAQAIGVRPSQLLENVLTEYDKLRADSAHEKKIEKPKVVTSHDPYWGVSSDSRVRKSYADALRGSADVEAAAPVRAPIKVAVVLQKQAADLRAKADELVQLSDRITDDYYEEVVGPTLDAAGLRARRPTADPAPKKRSAQRRRGGAR